MASAAPEKKDTLRLLVHFLLGNLSPEFAKVRRIGIYNPRLDTAYGIAVAEIPRNTLKSVESDYVKHVLADEKPARGQSSGTGLLDVFADFLDDFRGSRRACRQNRSP